MPNLLTVRILPEEFEILRRGFRWVLSNYENLPETFRDTAAEIDSALTEIFEREQQTIYRHTAEAAESHAEP